MRKRYLFGAVAMIVVILVIGSSIAYFTSTDSGANDFTVGSVKIQLTEPAWDPQADHLIQRGKGYDKDPTIKNIGSSEAFIRANVTVSDYRYMKDAVPEGFDLKDLFEGEGCGYEKDLWIPAGEGKVDEEKDTITYSFYYNTEIKPSQSTQSVFKKVIFPENFDVNSDDLKEEFIISVSADAVQSDTFEDSEKAFEMFDKKD